MIRIISFDFFKSNFRYLRDYFPYTSWFCLLEKTDDKFSQKHLIGSTFPAGAAQKEKKKSLQGGNRRSNFSRNVRRCWYAESGLST